MKYELGFLIFTFKGQYTIIFTYTSMRVHMHANPHTLIHTFARALIIFTPTYKCNDTTRTHIICSGAHIQHFISHSKCIFTSALVQ